MRSFHFLFLIRSLRKLIELFGMESLTTKEVEEKSMRWGFSECQVKRRSSFGNVLLFPRLDLERALRKNCVSYEKKETTYKWISLDQLCQFEVFCCPTFKMELKISDWKECTCALALKKVLLTLRLSFKPFLNFAAFCRSFFKIFSWTFDLKFCL